MSFLGRILSRLTNRGPGAHATRDEEEGHEPDPEDPALDPFDPFPEPVRVEITDVLDLHTIQPRDVKRLVESYLEEAREAGFRSCRIIHGKGVGVQRETVRRILARTTYVDSFADAPPEAGGWGATVVRFSAEKA